MDFVNRMLVGKGKIVFRVDSSLQIGSGHLMRCFAIAENLPNQKDIIFISRDLEKNTNDLIIKKGFSLFKLPHVIENRNLVGYEKWLTVRQEIDAYQTKALIRSINVDVLIVDSYAISEEWERIIQSYVKKLVVIDDLANRKHVCDVLIDQNFYKNIHDRYCGLVPDNCQLLLGPRYALLRKEFYAVKEKMRVRDGVIRNILVSFGGSDPTNETMKVLQAIRELDRTDVLVNVVLGGSNCYKDEVEKFCSNLPNICFHYKIDYMARLMDEADLSIGGGGISMWERCFLGLPAIVISLEENQVQVAEGCDELGCIKYLGKCEDVKSYIIKKEIMKYIKNPELLIRLGVKSQKVMRPLD